MAGDAGLVQPRPAIGLHFDATKGPSLLAHAPRLPFLILSSSALLYVCGNVLPSLPPSCAQERSYILPMDKVLERSRTAIVPQPVIMMPGVPPPAPRPSTKQPPRPQSARLTPSSFAAVSALRLAQVPRLLGLLPFALPTLPSPAAFYPLPLPSINLLSSPSKFSCFPAPSSCSPSLPSFPLIGSIQKYPSS